MNEKKTIKSFYYKIKHYLKHYLKYIDRKYGLKILNIEYYISDYLITFIISAAFVIFLYKSSIISIENNLIKFNMVVPISENVPLQLFIAQVSTTFIITAVTALLPNLSERKILGENSINRILGGKIFGITFVNIQLYILMLANAYFTMYTSYTGISLLLFLITILLILVCIIEITNIFVVPNKLMGKILYEYYQESLNLLKKDKPIRPYNNAKMQRYRETILEQILNRDLEYVNNIEKYKKMLETYLFNNSLKIQEYYTEMCSHEDFINHILIFIENLIITKEYTRAYSLYLYLLERLNYYNIYISSYRLITIYDMFINAIYDIEKHGEYKNYIEMMCNGWSFPIMNCILIQAYFKENNDFSYTRLGKLDVSNIRCSQCIPADYISKFYIAIRDSSCTIDKREIYYKIYDCVRMTISNLNQYSFYDITNFKAKYQETKERKYSYPTIGMPIVYLFMEFVKEKNVKNIKEFITMNIEKEHMCYGLIVIILTILSLMEKKNNYMYDISLSDDEANQILDIFSDSLMRFFLDDKQVKNIYASIINYNVKDKSNYKIYLLNRMYLFQEDLINTYFLYVFGYKEENNVILDKKRVLFDKYISKYNKDNIIRIKE